MFRQSPASRLYSSFGQQRKLFLLVFLWTCLCLVIFKSSLFGGKSQQQQQHQLDQIDQLELKLELSRQQSNPHNQQHANDSKLFARSPNWPPSSAGSSLGPPLDLAPEFALPDNSNALYYSLSSISSSSASAAAANEPQEKPSKRQQIPQKGENKQPTSSIKSHSGSTRHVASPAIAGSQCHYKYPNLLDLQFNNIHWQKMSTRQLNASSQSQAATFYLYNAYYDDRWRGGLPSVRVLAMIDRIQPPPTNCLLWSNKLSPHNTGHHHQQQQQQQQHPVPIVTRASFVYAWYPKWGNYKDGLLQPWIVTCPVPRAHGALVPDSVSLVEVPRQKLAPQRPPVIQATTRAGGNVIPVPGVADERRKRDLPAAAAAEAPSLGPPVVGSNSPSSFIAMPPSFSSSSPSISAASVSRPQASSQSPGQETASAAAAAREMIEYDCASTLPITNNLPVFNQRPAVKGKFAVCVKGLDFPHEDVSVRLVEWIELLNLLGAGKVFLYNLDVHENISKVLHYYQERGMVELSPLTLPGDQPNLPEYQHLYLKSKLTAKRQNELIPYNDCLYRNLNSYQYLALLDIDEIIMPLGRHHNWYDLMQEVESLSLAEQNYSRASYNVRNVYFFDDLAGPLGTTSSSSSSAPSVEQPEEEDEAAASGQETGGSGDSSLERGIPHYLHMMQHVYRSKNYTKPGQYVKCFHNTERVVSLHNHFPMNCFGQCTTYSVPVHLAHLQHYRKDCVGPLKQSCKNDFRVFTQRDTTIWKYKQQMIRRTTRVLNHLSLL